MKDSCLPKKHRVRALQYNAADVQKMVRAANTKPVSETGTVISISLRGIDTAAPETNKRKYALRQKGMTEFHACVTYSTPAAGYKKTISASS